MTHNNKAIADLFPYISMRDARQANARAGFKWFSRATMEWFRGRIESEVYGGGFFLSSEQQSSEHKRLYTLRRIMPDATVETIGDFQAYSCKSDARKALERAKEDAFVNRARISVKRAGYRWEIQAVGYRYGSFGTLVHVDSLRGNPIHQATQYGYGADGHAHSIARLADRPSREQERRAVRLLFITRDGGPQERTRVIWENSGGDAPYFERVRKTPPHSGRWLSSVYRIGG